MAAESCSAWGNVVTWGVVVAGWVVVHRATLSRERRKEQREAVRQIVEEIKVIEATAFEFHMAEVHSQLNANALTSKIDRVIRALQRQPLSILNVPIRPLIQFRKTITIENFDATGFAAQHANSQLIYGIRSAVDDLIHSIEFHRDKNIP